MVFPQLSRISYQHVADFVRSPAVAGGPSQNSHEVRRLGRLSLLTSLLVLWALRVPEVTFSQEVTQGAGQSSAKTATYRRPKTIPAQTLLENARRARSPLQNPDEHERHKDVELNLTTHTFDTPYANEIKAPSKLRLLCYNDARVGPTIRVRRGSVLRIDLKNQLKQVEPPPAGDGSKPGATDQAETPHDLCRTNLHTHGLHVSPADPSDNIFLGVDANQQRHFEFRIPDDHPSGTFWYHPHNHGSVAYQLSNGVAGALIVEGAPDDRIDDLEDIAEIAAAREQILLFQLYNIRVRADAQSVPVPGAVAWIDADSIYNMKVDATRCGAIAVDPQDEKTAAGSTTLQVTAINGQFAPTLTLRPGEVERWRLIHAGWDLDRHFTIVDDLDRPTTDISLYEIALDGLATGDMVRRPDVHVAPGQRSDVLVKVADDLLAPGEPRRIYHLKQNPLSAEAAPHGQAQDALYLAKIVIRGAPHRMNLPDRAEIAKCRPYADVKEGELAPGRKLDFSADDGDATTPPHYTINGKTFHSQECLRLRLDTAEEWTITASQSNHPFHIHVNPFQVVSYTDPQGQTSPMNVWRDTLFINEKETYTIRIRFRHFPGKSVLHCHILDHEDQGMMVPIELWRPGQAPPRQEQCAGATTAARLEATSIPAPNVTLVEPGGHSHRLEEFRGQTVVLVFFQNTECFHCAQQLRDLVQACRNLAEPKLRILAVSSGAIVDRDEARAALGATETDWFHLFQNVDQDAFRQFGCHADNQAQHGLCLIDREGTLRAKYSGTIPYPDVPEIVRSAEILLRD